MDALVLSTLLFNAAGIVAFALVLAVAYVKPDRRQFRSWVSSDALALPVAKEAELPHAA